MQTIGERLEDARKRKGISIREAAEATKIRGDYLQRFEGNQFDLGLAEIYVKGFLRSYSHFLNLPADRIINDFNALGLGSAGRARTPSREVYGRMDLTVATTGESGTQDPGTPPAGGEPPSAPPRRHPAAFARGGGNLHNSTGMDPALVTKIVLGVVGVVVVVLVIWGLKSMFSGNERASPVPTASNVPAAPEETITIIAIAPTTVEVTVKNPDGTAGAVLLPRTALVRNEQRVVPWRSALYIYSSVTENVRIEVRGTRVALEPSADKRNLLPAPNTRSP